MSARGIRSITRLAAGIADVLGMQRAIQQLEDRVRDMIGHWHDEATTREAGFAPKLSGVSTDTLHGDGVYRSDAAAGVPSTRLISTASPLTDGGDLSADRTIDFDETVAIGNNARVTVRKNTGADVGTRRRLNLIEGSGVTLTIADDAGSEEVDITIAASGGGGGASATTVEKDLGATPAWEGHFTITDAAIGTSSKVKVWQAPGPYTGKGTLADEAALQPVSVIATEPAAGSCTVYWQTPPAFALRRRLHNAAGPAFTTAPIGSEFGAAFDDVELARINKVEGNVKFTYVIYA